MNEPKNTQQIPLKNHAIDVIKSCKCDNYVPTQHLTHNLLKWDKRRFENEN